MHYNQEVGAGSPGHDELPDESKLGPLESPDFRGKDDRSGLGDPLSDGEGFELSDYVGGSLGS